jgi:hypothetical protein
MTTFAALAETGELGAPARADAGRWLYQAIAGGDRVALDRLKSRPLNWRAETIRGFQLEMTEKGIYTGKIAGIIDTNRASWTLQSADRLFGTARR